MRKFMNIKIISKVLFLLVGLATIYEYLFVSGMFTGPLMMGMSVIAGSLNILIECKDKDYLNVGLYLVATASLCAGYIKMLFL